MENTIQNPYPQDTTITEFLNLYVHFLSSWTDEIDKTQFEVKNLHGRVEQTRKEVKDFEKYIWGNLTQIIKMLPKSKCPFCGNDVIDKAPLIPFLDKFEPYWDDDGHYWTNFWKGNKLKFNMECVRCHAFRTTEYAYNDSGFQKWIRKDKRRPQLVSFIFKKCSFINSISRTKDADDWYFSFDNGEFWEIEGTKEKIIRVFNLPDPMYCGDY